MPALLTIINYDRKCLKKKFFTITNANAIMMQCEPLFQQKTKYPSETNLKNRKTFVFFGVHRVSNEPYDMVNVTHCMIGYADNLLSYRDYTREGVSRNNFSRIY